MDRIVLPNVNLALKSVVVCSSPLTADHNSSELCPWTQLKAQPFHVFDTNPMHQVGIGWERLHLIQQKTPHPHPFEEVPGLQMRCSLRRREAEESKQVTTYGAGSVGHWREDGHTASTQAAWASSGVTRSVRRWWLASCAWRSSGTRPSSSTRSPTCGARGPSRPRPRPATAS